MKNESHHIKQIINKKQINLSQGVSVIELIIYCALFILLSTAMVKSLISMTNSFSAVQTNLRLSTSASAVMERMSREIALAETIDTVNSTFGTSPGVLQFTYTSSGTQTIKFMVVNGVLKFYRGGTLIGNLTGPNVTVTSLIFNNITSGNGGAIKISMTLQDTKSLKSESFYLTVKERGTY